MVKYLAAVFMIMILAFIYILNHDISY